MPNEYTDITAMLGYKAFDYCQHGNGNEFIVNDTKEEN